ncbi:hypothetical protein GJ654_10490 [Rhodoblastus acidophilus]|uniref:Holin of 3TMs, for gene-transfer release n=1 Tax=Rhodoblastus acidophilus TaxID=1074 RepID=A0A6N8DLF4_RHOAC|nr:hypothetical protein [Rhodoblastus acidophilus]MCW2275154.1 hypothetical protein [Rhodoblastus acidophilus]MTV31422.1 hypothetical protein [Rhodoblastus acidophilus]
MQFDPKALEILGLEIAKIGAPIIGRALGGPLGATIASGVVGALAEALGVDATPEAVTNAVQANPQVAVAAAQQVEQDGAGDLKPILDMLTAVEPVELASEDRFVRWARPSAIWVISAVTLGYGGCIVAATVKYLDTNDPAALAVLLTNAPSLSLALAPVAAIAGVSAWWRSKEKIAGLPNGFDGLVKKRK